MLKGIFWFLLTSFVVVEAQFVIDRGESDVFRNLTGCSNETENFCYFLHAEESPLDPCVCRCLVKYPMYRNPDVFLSGGGEFMSKGKPACVWHSNHRYECFHIRKLGRGFNTSDDEGALEFDLSKPGTLMAFADHDLSHCTRLKTAIKMPEEHDFTPKTGILNVAYGRFDVIDFQWSTIAERYDGGILRGVFEGCSGNVDEAGRCFVGKISGIYNGGSCSVRALNGECCIFPFTYKGQVYNNCTNVDNVESWCAVRLPFFGNETNWWQNCTDTSKIIPSSSLTIQRSLISNVSQTPNTNVSRTQTINLSQTPTATLPMTKMMVLETAVVSLKHSLLQLESTQILKSTAAIKNPLGPKPESARLVRGSIILPEYNMSTSTFKLSPTINKPSMSNYVTPQFNQTPSTIDHTASIDDYRSSLSGYNSTMVNNKSSISDYPLTPSKVYSINFTSFVSDKLSVIVSTSDYVPSMTDHKTRMSDYISSISDYKMTLSGINRSMSSTNQTYDYKPPQTVLKPTSAQVTSSPLSSPVLPDHKAIDSKNISTLAIVIVVVMAIVTTVAVSILCLFFLCLRYRKNRNKKYGLVYKKPGNETAHSPASPRPDSGNPTQSDVVAVEDSESETAETEFGIPEKDGPGVSDKPSDKDEAPAYMTFRL